MILSRNRSGGLNGIRWTVVFEDNKGFASGEGEDGDGGGCELDPRDDESAGETEEPFTGLSLQIQSSPRRVVVKLKNGRPDLRVSCLAIAPGQIEQPSFITTNSIPAPAHSKQLLRQH